MRKILRQIGLYITIMAMSVAISAAGSLAGEEEAVGSKIRVIVGTFQDKSAHRWYHGANPGTGMADMLISALVKSGKFKVFARAQLEEILAEKNLSLSDLANPGFEAANKLEIGDYLVSASITEFGYKEKKVGGSKFGLGKLGFTEYTGRVAVDLQLIHLGTSEIVFADNVNKSEKSKSLGVGTGDFSFGSHNTFDDHVVGKATRKTINAIADILSKNVSVQAWPGGYLIVSDDMLFFETGSEMGIKKGMKFDVKRVKKEIKNRDGKVIKVIYENVGVIEVTEVEEGLTTCRAVSGSGFLDDDLVRPQK